MNRAASGTMNDGSPACLNVLRENHSIMRGHDLWLKQRKNQLRTDTKRCTLSQILNPICARA